MTEIKDMHEYRVKTELMDKLDLVYQDRKNGIRNLTLMTIPQKESRDRIIKDYERIPKNEFYDMLNNCYFLEYDSILIGIESDGYLHS